jgi:hypothetical protein
MPNVAYPDIGDILNNRNVHSAREALVLWYGFLQTTQPIENDYSPTNSAIAIGKYNSLRLGYIISNTGTANIALGFSAGVTISTGILLQQGQAFTSNWLTDGEAVWAPLYVISTAGGGTVHVVENVLQGG